MKLDCFHFCRGSLRRPSRQRANRRFVILPKAPRIANLAAFQDRTHLFPQQRSMLKRKRKERDKRSQDRQNEQPSQKNYSATPTKRLIGNRPSSSLGPTGATRNFGSASLIIPCTHPTAGGVCQSSPICSSAGASIPLSSHLSMGSSASIQNAAKAAISDWHEEEEGC